MRLSDAIRKGCTLYPVQLFDKKFYLDSTCAWGAAEAGVGRSVKWPSYLERFALQQVACPACDDNSITLQNCVFHLNDDHHWTREAIADWVESIEMGERETHEVSEHAEVFA